MWYDDLFPRSRPVFVMGAARSGTSIVADMLRLGAGLPGSWEGHLFQVAYLALAELEGLWSRIGPPMTELGRQRRDDPEPHRAVHFFDIDALKRDVLRHFDRIQRARWGHRWLDKTPELHMLHAAPMLAGAYPRSRFLIVIRNGIRVMLSRQRTHPEMGFGEACEDWARCCGDWLRHRDALGPRFLEVRYESLTTEPEDTCGRIARHFQFDQGAATAMLEVLRSRRIHPTSDDPAAEITLGSTPWNAAQRATFVETCGALMDELGYAM